MKKLVLLWFSLGIFSFALAADSLISKEEARILLAGHKLIQARYKIVDVSGVDPEGPLRVAEVALKTGVTCFLQSSLKNYTKNPHILSTAHYMAKIFSTGKLHIPTPNDLERPNLKKNVCQVYDFIINHFLWEDGHSTEVLAEEVAAQLVLQAQLQKLKALWQ